MTPFALVTLNGPSGWKLFCIVWGLAVVGIIQEIWLARGARLSSLVIYLVMGFAAVIAADPLVEAIAWDGVAWLVAGGIAYMIGILFFMNDDRFPHWHGIWHVCVLAGSALHYAAIVKFVA